ncbi:uncharacterized protein LOC135828363 [Sycon ciliatum]|uniref:uncharacterized protein LOC135828363 n=1 Tax=Sycon ciliatum TaxID=27933 RepID=UPI0031F68A32
MLSGYLEAGDRARSPQYYQSAERRISYGDQPLAAATTVKLFAGHQIDCTVADYKDAGSEEYECDSACETKKIPLRQLGGRHSH